MPIELTSQSDVSMVTRLMSVQLRSTVAQRKLNENAAIRMYFQYILKNCCSLNVEIHVVDLPV